MNTILCRLKEAFPWVGKRAATETDFYNYCDARGVRVNHSLAVRDGLYIYFPYDGSEHIFLNSRLYGFSLLYVMFHELGHQMFHVPSRTVGVEHFDRSLCRRNHAEAEAVAALMLFTPEQLEQAVTEGRHLATNRVGSLVRLRYRLWAETL